MALIAVKFPDEKWRKVNVSRFLKKFEEVPVSKLVKVPEGASNILSKST